MPAAGVKEVSIQPTLEEAKPAGTLELRQDGPTGSELVLMFERLARDPSVDVDKMERLIAMQERILRYNAESAYHVAMNAAQKEMRPVAADAWNPSTKSKYASYEALDLALRPIYTRHGFSLSFNTADAPLPEYVRVLCKSTHLGGHTEIHVLDMPADGKGAKGGDVMTKTHATGSALSYGQRYLLKMIFNIAVGEEDDDGNAAGRKPEKELPPAPDGYTAWLAIMEGFAEGGDAQSFKDAWNKSEQFRTYLGTTAPEQAKALKRKAGLKV